ncbi:replication-relaxation family protein [Plantactinospora sp. S1510]|uniref:Replication-relaxation family protein n=1 Tax=Plantactinospora alkalitolerans TaxID=2789879 RepID=A0ABS0H8S9_9ACTN|nr:replication-relaxation family protein [Plantactinospora alkalitolerans]MBF9134714.1 replication-relaxation family protein [Plantactinospora alkalitolerans]
MYSRVPSPSSKPDPLAVFGRIVPRDHALLGLLAEHYLLSTDQITSVFFDARRTAQRRLTILHRLDVLHRFGRSGDAGRYGSLLYTLGPIGLQLHPTVYHDPAGTSGKPLRSSVERAKRIAASGQVNHLLGVNQFFTDLLATARHDDGLRLSRWWSEQHATTVYAQSGIRPDGHGVWTVGDHSTGFFLEHDNDTENLARVVAKLRGYERLTSFGPRYPVLFWVPSRRREASLLGVLAGLRTASPIATAVHGPDPAGRVWTLVSDPTHRRYLHELPSDHGPDAVTNPQRFDDL